MLQLSELCRCLFAAELRSGYAFLRVSAALANMPCVYSMSLTDVSSTKYVQCTVCLDECAAFTARASWVFLEACGHWFCAECARRLFELSRDDSCHMPPRCSCGGLLRPSLVRHLFDVDFCSRWNEAYYAFLLAKFSDCPRRHCPGKLVPEPLEPGVSICNACQKRACRACGRRHHDGPCANTESGPSSDASFFLAARRSGWQCCAGCGRFLERTEGCCHMTWYVFMCFPGDQRKPGVVLTLVVSAFAGISFVSCAVSSGRYVPVLLRLPRATTLPSLRMPCHSPRVLVLPFRVRQTEEDKTRWAQGGVLPRPSFGIFPAIGKVY